MAGSFDWEADWGKELEGFYPSTDDTHEGLPSSSTVADTQTRVASPSSCLPNQLSGLLEDTENDTQQERGRVLRSIRQAPVLGTSVEVLSKLDMDNIVAAWTEAAWVEAIPAFEITIAQHLPIETQSLLSAASTSANKKARGKARGTMRSKLRLPQKHFMPEAQKLAQTRIGSETFTSRADLWTTLESIDLKPLTSSIVERMDDDYGPRRARAEGSANEGVMSAEGVAAAVDVKSAVTDFLVAERVRTRTGNPRRSDNYRRTVERSFGRMEQEEPGLGVDQMIVKVRNDLARYGTGSGKRGRRPEGKGEKSPPIEASVSAIY